MLPGLMCKVASLADGRRRRKNGQMKREQKGEKIASSLLARQPLKYRALQRGHVSSFSTHSVALFSHTVLLHVGYALQDTIQLVWGCGVVRGI